MPAKSPTLTDIRNLINANHQEVTVRLSAVEEQVRLTNGRVKALETESAVAKGIKEYKEAQASSNPKVGWLTDWKTLFTVFLALCAALIAIGQAIGR